MSILLDVLGLAGIAAICYGAFLASDAVGYSVLGVCLSAVAIVGTITRNRTKDRTDDS